MSSGRKRSVAVIVAATLVTVTTLLFVSLAAMNYVSGRRAEEERLRHGAVSQTEELAAALALPVWNIDRAQIDKILDSQAKTPPVQAVVVEAAGKIQARARDGQWRFVPSDGNISPAGLLVSERVITFAGQRIGSVRLFATPRFLEQQLRDSLLSMARMTLSVDLLLILSVYLVLWRAVVRPLTEIEKFAVAVSSGGATRPAMLITERFPSELASVHSSIDTMVNQLREQVARSSVSEARFRSIFDAVNDAIVINDIETGAILEVNGTMCAMFGYTAEELKNLDIAALSARTSSFTANDALARIRKADAGEEQLFEW
ncbi:MAG: PAS domain S-box protein, partial [Thermoanaerobaculia bacterium]